MCEPGISLDRLLSESGGNWTRDAVYTLIASDHIYADLKGARLSQPDKVEVFPTASAAALRQAGRISRSVTCEPPRPLLEVGDRQLGFQNMEDR
jgi:hypothetical protein